MFGDQCSQAMVETELAGYSDFAIHMLCDVHSDLDQYVFDNRLFRIIDYGIGLGYSDFAIHMLCDVHSDLDQYVFDNRLFRI